MIRPGNGECMRVPWPVVDSDRHIVALTLWDSSFGSRFRSRIDATHRTG